MYLRIYGGDKMIYTIPARNCPTVLADAIEQSQDGDMIQVRNQAQKELAERAKRRMCPDKQIVFEIKEGLQIMREAVQG
jgi:hypothetical protein